MKTKSEYSKDQYIAEVIALWEDVVRTVYLKEPKNHSLEIAQRAWEGTNMLPIDYVKFVADPKRITNMIGRGQTARELRWTNWLRNKQSK